MSITIAAFFSLIQLIHIPLLHNIYIDFLSEKFRDSRIQTYISEDYFLTMADYLTDGKAQVKIKEKHFKSPRLDTSYNVERAAESI